ncbi:MAG: sigma-70 family RNA polymerase sigma factor [Cyanobacteria bacterium]|nr:sigma-70 family RNA polymerase sigma factor [Cyanobacteriota bacterium]
MFAERTHRLIAPAVVRGLRQFGAAPARELVDDLVQDTFLKLCENNLAALRRFRGERPEGLIAYLKIVACNVARDHARASLAGKRGSGRVEAAADEVIAAALDPATEREAADARLLIEEIDRHLAANEAAGGARDRSIFWLYYRQGLTARAIAGMPAIGLSQKGVESTIYRLTRVVREMLAWREGDRVENASS